MADVHNLTFPVPRNEWTDDEFARRFDELRLVSNLYCAEAARRLSVTQFVRGPVCSGCGHSKREHYFGEINIDDRGLPHKMPCKPEFNVEPTDKEFCGCRGYRPLE